MADGGKTTPLRARRPAASDDAAQLRLIADNVPAMTIAYDERLVCTFANRRFAEFFGLTTETIVGKHLREIIGEAPYREVKPYFDRVLAGERTTYKRTRILPNGERRYLEVELMPHIGEDGRRRGLFAVTADVTERRREEQLRMLGLTVPALIADADSTSTAIRSVIRAICESEGWECGRYLAVAPDGSMRQTEAWGIDDPDVQRFLERARAVTPDLKLRGGFQFPVKSAGRTIGLLAFNSRERREPDERVLSAILAIGSQIGQFLESKRAQEHLRDSEARFRTVVDSVDEGILVYDREVKIVSVNAAAERILGLPREKLLGAPGFVSLLQCIREDGTPVHSQDRAPLFAMSSRQPIAGRVIGIRRDTGATTWLAANTALLFDAGRSAAEPYGCVTTLTDITPLKRDEELLRLEGRVAQAFDSAQDARSAVASAIQAVCESENWHSGRFLEVAGGELRHFADWSVGEPSVVRYLELSRAARYRPGVGLVGTVWQSREPLWVPDIGNDPRVARPQVAKETGTRAALTVPVLARDEVIGVLIFQSRQARAPDARLLQAMQLIGGQVGQFLERKRAEEQVRASESRFRTMIESANEGILVFDREMRIVSANDAAERILGLPKEKLLGAQGFVSLLPCIREDGSLLSTKEPVSNSVIGVRREGAPTTWLATNTGLLYEEGRSAENGDEPDGAVATLTDITRLKRDEELLRLEQRIARAFDSEEDARSALRAAIQAVCEDERWVCGRYLEVAGGLLRAFAHWSTDDPAMLRYLERVSPMTFKPGEGLVGIVWQSRQPLWVRDISHGPAGGRPALAVDMGAKSVLVVPVLALDAVIGVFIFHSREMREADQRLLEAMQLIGGQIGQLVRRAKAEDAVRESEARFRSLCALSSDVFWEQDAQFRFTAINDSSGALDSGMLGKPRWEQPLANMSAEDWAAHRAVLEAHQPFRDLELCRIGEDGREIWYSVSGEPVFDASGAFTGYRGVGRNITPRKLDERRIRHLASHDALTALPNRAAFSELLNAARESARRHSRALAVMFVDLDRFKVINDTLGHEAGDEVLCEVARRLRNTLRASDVVARLGGDEFVIMIPELDSTSQAETTARKVLGALIAPMTIGGRELTLTASIGLALYPQDGADEQSLMKNADAAMYRAKEAGRNNYKFHNAASDRRSLERLAMETSLRRGLERSEFFLNYQPRVSLASGAVTGVEALARWRHPELGVVPPGEFIALAEETGAIHEIGGWVLQAACVQAAQWHRAGLPPVQLAVNVSARQFANDNLVAQISSALQASGLAPQRLELEITESAVAQNVERAVQILSAVRALGVRVALDDFGTGYSSLAQLKRFPIDTIKVDRAFVAELPHNADDAAIAHAIITMGRRLRRVVVAEGVETQAQYEFLKAHGCDEMQGFLVSQPLGAEDCAEFLRGAGAR
jgi:diguanylate cyclase (GGDEF)-like protein/PAS domain S-box-containing protein